MKTEPALFENHSIRRVYDKDAEAWWFSVVDIVQALTGSTNPRDYWFKMKQRVRQEDGAELSTICRQLKMTATDGKQRPTDVASAETLLRLVQSVYRPSRKLN